MDKVLKKMVMEEVTRVLKDVPYKEGIRGICINRESDFPDPSRGGKPHWKRPRVIAESCNGVDGEPEYYTLRILSRTMNPIIDGYWGEARVHIHFDENHAENSPVWFMAAILLGFFHKSPDINAGEHPLGDIDYIIENYQQMQQFEDNPALKEKLRQAFGCKAPIKIIRKPKPGKA